METKLIIRICFSLLGILIFNSKGYSQFGQLDHSFDTDGIVQSVIGNYSVASSLAVQSDGKIVVTGNSGMNSNSDFLVQRFNKNGSIDTSFNHIGYSTLSFSIYRDFANSVFIQQDEKIVVSGYCYANGYNDLVVVRFNSDGTLDSTFSLGGIFIWHIPTSSEYIFDGDQLTNGNLIFCGIYHYNGMSSSSAMIINLTSSGIPDSSFDQDGIWEYNSSAGIEAFYAMAIQPDNKIVLGGASGLAGSQDSMIILRLNPNGQLDSTFNQNGAFVYTEGVSSRLYDIQVQNDGHIIATGYTSAPDSVQILTVLRVTPMGDLDTSFNSNGIFHFAIGTPSNGKSMVLQSDKKVIVGGSIFNGNNWDFVLLRLYPNGGIDSVFGNSGVNIHSVNPNLSDKLNCVKLQQDNKIIMCGFSDLSLVVARYDNEPTHVTQLEMLSSNFLLYPNPIRFSFSLETKEPLKNGTLRCFDLSGRLVKTYRHLFGTKQELNCNAISPGLYSFVLYDENIHFSRKSYMVISP